MIAMRSVTRRRRLLLCTVPLRRRRQGVAVCMSAADTVIQNRKFDSEIVLGFVRLLVGMETFTEE